MKQRNFQEKLALWSTYFSSIILVVLLVLSLVACGQKIYTDTGVEGIRRVEKVRMGKENILYYQKYDYQTGKYFEAEQNAQGEWVYTEEGLFLRDFNREDFVDGS